MKKIKSGFTLAEVLITLAVIGIIAAIVLPSVIAGYQYKTIGVKLSKFATSLEQAARAYVVGDPFALTDNTRLRAQLQHFANDTFVIKYVSGNKGDCTGLTEDELTTCNTANNAISDDALKANVLAISSYQDHANPSYKPLSKKTGSAQSGTTEGTSYMSAILKDGTAVTIAPLTQTQSDSIASEYDKTGVDVRVRNLVDEYKFGLPVAQVRFDPNVSGLPNDAHQSYYFYITQNGYVTPAVEDDCVVGIYLNEWKASADMYASSGACGTGGKISSKS